MHVEVILGHIGPQNTSSVINALVRQRKRDGSGPSSGALSRSRHCFKPQCAHPGNGNENTDFMGWL